MTYEGDRPLTADPATVAALQEYSEHLDTHALTKHARTLGLRPPDERPGWYVVKQYDIDGKYQGLFWVGPDDD